MDLRVYISISWYHTRQTLKSSVGGLFSPPKPANLITHQNYRASLLPAVRKPTYYLPYTLQAAATLCRVGVALAECEVLAGYVILVECVILEGYELPFEYMLAAVFGSVGIYPYMEP
jgi:hypothetical protein